MGYTLSFVADVKCGMDKVAGLLHHDARSVDKDNGCETRHSNKDIDASRTGLNDVVVSDGKGGWMPCTDTRQIMTALSDRLAHVKKPLRRDAVVLRPMILQLDPEWYAAHTEAVDRDTAEQHMMDWAADTFGRDNLVYVAAHHDEGNPHLHIGFCPVTDDGRLSQKDWFSGPSRLREMHNEFRGHMVAAGYDIDMGRRKPGKHAKRMSVDEYKDFARLQDERRDVEQQREQLTADQEQLHADRLNARHEAQRIRQQAQTAGAVYVANAQATAAAAEDEAIEYRARRHAEADREADEIRAQATRDAEAIREAARQDAERTAAEAARQAEAVQVALRQRVKASLDEARQERDQAIADRDRAQTARRATVAALQGDYRAWAADTRRPTATALLGVLGAAVEASRTPPTSQGVGRAWEQLQAMLAKGDNPGPAAVEGPTR